MKPKNDLKRAEIICRLKSGERKSDVARSLGMSKQAMHYYAPIKPGVCSQCQRPFVKSPVPAKIPATVGSGGPSTPNLK